MKSRLLLLTATCLCSLLLACGGGGSSGSSASSSANSTASAGGDNGAANTVLAGTSVDTISYGVASDFNSATTVASLFEKARWYLNPKNFSFFKTAYASVGCSNSRIITGNASEAYSAYDVIANNDGDGVSVSGSGSSECVTAMQDGANYVVFTTNNLTATAGNCDLNLLRKSDGKHFCLTTDISSLIGASQAVAASYDLGNLPVTFADDYVKEYFTNRNGFKAGFTLNGKYLFASFTATSGGQNYIGITRFNLSTKNKPTSTIVWLKPQNAVTGGGYASDTVDVYLRGFIGLEYGDIVVDYINNYSTGGTYSIPLNPPPTVATRYYISVDSSKANPNNQKGFILTYGNPGFGHAGWFVTGQLWSYLSASGSNANTITYTNTYNNYSVRPYDGSTSLSGVIFINSDPASSEKAFYIKLQATSNSLTGVRSGESCDYVKVVVGSDVSTTPIQSISHLGSTYTCHQSSGLVGGYLYSWNSYQDYAVINASNGIVNIPTDRGITAHPISGTSSTSTSTVYITTPSTFTRSFLQSKTAFYVLDGFNGYFGGNNTGTNSIFVVEPSNSSHVGSKINLRTIADGLYVASNASINPKTNQIQISGPKKAAQNDYYNNILWTAYVDKNGAGKVRTYPNINPPYGGSSQYATPTKPLISLKNSDGTIPSYATE